LSQGRRSSIHATTAEKHCRSTAATTKISTMTSTPLKGEEEDT
jgi:hypothetical protein